MTNNDKIIIYTTKVCPYCIRAKELLQKNHANFEEIRVDLNDSLREEMMQKTNRRTVPQIFFGTKHIGGYDELYTLQKTGQLNDLIAPFIKISV